MRFPARTVGAAVLLAAALGLLIRGEPSLDDRVDHRRAEHDRVLASRALHADVGEVLTLMHNNQIRLALLDARDEADYNLFHLQDAQRVSRGTVEDAWLRELPADAVKIVMSNDEAAAETMWRYLATQGHRNLYVMAGGVNAWLRAFERYADDGALRLVASEAPDTRRYEFPAALGARYPIARPALEVAETRRYEPVVKAVGPVRDLGGGCG